MTHTIPSRDPEQRFDTVEQIERLLDPLLGRASQRQFWVLLFDAERRLLDPIMPFEGVPSDPDELSDTSDLGRVPFATVLRHRIAWLATTVGADSWVGVIERVGAERFTPADCAWARSMAAPGAPGIGAPPVRAQFVLHDSGVRQLTADDYL
ncbi:hypothetical protein [Leucobacter luti]|uniref:Uncharacterized protein n=1 Tax=Leucobacter luti TaxID=340320 RepID=A0A4Q7U7Q3_9MICO|nr:hypothetical protein [Leucobacter luti]MBL3700939.1 hypothetical protein [Leucobacter luti]RZT68840.1 hypothetical protein EV139_0569 [Leucobacter luti]